MKHLLPLLFSALAIPAFAQVEFYAPANPSTGGSTAQDFETAYDQYDAQGADDFTVPAGVTWYIDSILVPGSYSSGAATTCGIIYNIHTDNSGEPSTTIVAGDTINADLDGNGDGDLVVYFETPLQITSGTYWFVANGRKNFASGGGQWYWQRDIDLTGYPCLWRNPGNGFGTTCTGWTTFYDCTALGISDSGLAFSMYGCYGPTKPIGTGFDTLLCAGTFNNVTLTGDTTGSQANVSYLWSTGATTQSISVSTSGTYTLYAEDSITLCGRTASYDVGIGSVPQPQIDDDTLCGASSIPATWGPIGGCQDCITIWGDSSTGAFYSTFTGGMVTVTVLDTVSGCSSSDTANLTVVPADATIQPGSLIDLCEGSDVTVSTLETLTNYSWSFTPDGSNWSSLGTNATAVVIAGGSVAVSGINSAGCEVFDTAQVILRPAPVPTISSTGLSSGNIQLNVSGTYNSYLWDDGSVGQNITVTSNGIYTVTVTDEFGCEGSAFFNVFNVGTEDLILNQLEIYPNPANDRVSIQWPAAWVGSATANIVDMQGRTLMSTRPNEMLQTLDVQVLSSGTYLLQLETPDGTTTTTLVISR